MAFDRPIDADKIRTEEFGLFSAFVHAPLWILGSVLKGDKTVAGSSSFDEEDTTTQKGSARLVLNDNNVVNNNSDVAESSSLSSSRVKQPLHDDGGAMMLAKKLRQTNLDSTFSNPIDVTGSSPSRVDDETQQHNSLIGFKRTKKMSWSDESGQSLVEYANESVLDQSSSSAPVQVAPTAKPIKSALKRSTRSTGGLTESVPTRYVPNMTRNEKGLIMPTRPYGGGEPVGNGVDSPQWGWYINTTPPTPEMYHSYVSGKALRGSDMFGARSSLTQGNQITQPKDAKPHHNQVFQNLRASQGPTMGGWPSVPI